MVGQVTVQAQVGQRHGVTNCQDLSQAALARQDLSQCVVELQQTGSHSAVD